GEFAEANMVLSEALGLARASADAFASGSVLSAYGMLANAQGEYEQAATYLHDGLAISRTIERESYRSVGLIRTQVQLGFTDSKRDAPDAARDWYTEGLVLLRQSGLAGRMLAYCLDGMGAAFWQSGDHVRAVQLLGAADTYWRAIRAVPF